MIISLDTRKPTNKSLYSFTTKTWCTRNREEYLYPSKDYQKSTTNIMYIGETLEAFLLRVRTKQSFLLFLYLFKTYFKSSKKLKI